MLKELEGSGLIIHHWDADGICSAKLMLDHLSDKNITNKTPSLGNYFLTEEELDSFSLYDFVIILDMSLPESNILRLSKNSKVMIFDHHLGKIVDEVFHYNPVIKGENPDFFPSASFIVNDYLENEVNLFSLLGVVGDHEQKIKDNLVFYEKIKAFCDEHDLSFDDMLDMVYLIDSNYKIGDKEAVEHAPHFLLENGSPRDILGNKEWNNNLNKLNNEINRILAQPGEESRDIIVKSIDTPYNIISTVTRKISWDTDKNTLVVNTGFFDDCDQVYMRSKKNAEPMIKRGKELGFKCGGKKEVLGAIVPKDKTDFFVDEILDFLKE